LSFFAPSRRTTAKKQQQPFPFISRRQNYHESEKMDSPAVRAPDFPDTLDWIHTGGKRLSLADFRGRVLLLDFWTYG
jgi:hypothetical protein